MLPEGEALTDLTDGVITVKFLLLLLLLQVGAVVNDGAGVAQPPRGHPARPQADIKFGFFRGLEVWRHYPLLLISLAQKLVVKVWSTAGNCGELWG